jgi:hypothetical protein
VLQHQPALLALRGAPVRQQHLRELRLDFCEGQVRARGRAGRHCGAGGGGGGVCVHAAIAPVACGGGGAAAAGVPRVWLSASHSDRWPPARDTAGCPRRRGAGPGTSVPGGVSDEGRHVDEEADGQQQLGTHSHPLDGLLHTGAGRAAALITGVCQRDRERVCV